MLLFVVLWIYGRKRFQRDIEFMLGKQIPSWNIFILRFVAPIILVICLVCFELTFGVTLILSASLIAGCCVRCEAHPLPSSGPLDVHYTGGATHSGHSWLWILLPFPEPWHLSGPLETHLSTHRLVPGWNGVPPAVRGSCRKQWHDPPAFRGYRGCELSNNSKVQNLKRISLSLLLL